MLFYPFPLLVVDWVGRTAAGVGGLVGPSSLLPYRSLAA